MSIGILLLEFALLGFIAVVYALARRNLSAAASREQADRAQSLREVQETVAGLISVLQTEAAAIEERLAGRTRKIEALLGEMEQRAAASAERAAAPSDRPSDGEGEKRQASQDAAPSGSRLSETPIVAPDAPVSAIERAMQLIASGETALAAARQTALTVTEVEMAARMRGVRVRRQ